VLSPAVQDHLLANLRYLSAPVRAAVESALQDGLRTDGSGRPGGTTLLGPDGRWYPLHGEGDAAVNRKLLDRILADPEPPLLILVGAGLGYLLDAIAERSRAMKVLLLEPVPAVARQMLARRDWTDWLSTGRLTLLVGPDYHGAIDAWRLVVAGGATPPTFVLPVVERVAPEDTAQAKHVAARIVAGAKANDEARKRFAGRYLLNTLANLTAVLGEGDVAALDGLWAGQPTVLVAAGPSLDRNLVELRAVADRVLLVAVDTAVRPLLAAGVRPQIVVAVDPSEPNARHMRGLSDVRGMWLVGEGSIDPAVLTQFIGRTFTFKVSHHHPWPWLASHGVGRGGLQAWGSVLTTAFDLALHLGADPIVFAGADLAYTDGQLYCRNTVYEPEWQHLSTGQRADEFRGFIEAQGQITEPGLSGDAVITAPRFVQFRDWIVSRARVTDRRIVNATGAGVLMGPRIVQASLTSLFRSTPRTVPAEDVQSALRAAWATGEAGRASELERVAAAAATPGRDTVDAWVAFGGDTASRGQITAQAKEAQRRIDDALRARTFLERRRAAYDARVTSRETAEELSHGNYAVAQRRAPSTQAHLLLEHAQRTYTVDPRATMPEVVAMASALGPGLRALDFGCGVGRHMETLVRHGIRVDGVDISPRLLDHARADPALRQCQFFLGRGDDCGDAPDGAYDIVYAHLVFRYIPSRSLRREILRAMARALRPDGTLLVQMRFHQTHVASTIPAPHVPWSADHYDAAGFAGEEDVWPTPDQLPLVYADFCEHFRDVRFQFLDIPAETGTPHQLIVTGSPTLGLARRMHAISDDSADGAQLRLDGLS
jgi:SAM-dependent methyltransferase